MGRVDIDWRDIERKPSPRLFKVKAADAGGIDDMRQEVKPHRNPLAPLPFFEQNRLVLDGNLGQRPLWIEIDRERYLRLAAFGEKTVFRTWQNAFDNVFADIDMHDSTAGNIVRARGPI